MSEHKTPRAAARALSLTALLAGVLFCVPAAAGPLDEMSVERWAKLREAERFQLNAAEKLFRDKQWKVAADEYEKFLKLYDRSEGASFAQLKWAHCQVHLRKLNTAVKDGYQTLLDYFPESPEAPLAALLIGRTHKDTGDLKAAKAAYAKAIAAHPKHFVAAAARLDLVEIAGKENDDARRGALLRELTFDVERTGPTAKECADASRMYARHAFTGGDFEEGVKALATTYKDADLPVQLTEHKGGRLDEIVRGLTGSTDAATKQRGEKLADAAVAWLKGRATAAAADKGRAMACWYAAADIQGSARRPDKQREVYDGMLTTFGPSDPLLGRLAQWFKENKQPDKARETYLRFQDVTEGLSQVAHSYVEEKKYDAAVEAYRKLAVQDAKGGSKWTALVAATYRKAGKTDLAIAVYRDLLSTDPGHAATWQWETAETLFHAGRWKDALTTYRGTDRFPANYDRMATAHRKLKQYDEAVALYQQIVAASPPHAPAALLDAAHTLEQAGKTEPAIKVFKQVCDRYPKTSEASAASSHLNTKYKIAVTLGGAKD